MTAHGNINLVPLVDILTSIVFFSLLTYTGAILAQLTAFDLSLPPVMVTQEQATHINPRDLSNLLLAVKIRPDGMDVQHSDGLNQKINGLDEPALVELAQVMRQVKQQYPQNNDVLIVPADAVSYDNVVRVLERLRMVGYTGLSLGTQARSEVARTGGRVR
jgi:biopolymer transport protein ExbD